MAPQQCRWWGCVAYDEGHHLIANAEDRYSINNKIVKPDDDNQATWTAHFCAERPAGATEMGQWLPMGPRRPGGGWAGDRPGRDPTPARRGSPAPSPPPGTLRLPDRRARVVHGGLVDVVPQRAPGARRCGAGEEGERQHQDANAEYADGAEGKQG